MKPVEPHVQRTWANDRSQTADVEADPMPTPLLDGWIIDCIVKFMQMYPERRYVEMPVHVLLAGSDEFGYLLFTQKPRLVKT